MHCCFQAAPHQAGLHNLWAQTRQPASTPVWPAPVSSGSAFPPKQQEGWALAVVQALVPLEHTGWPPAPTVAARGGYGDNDNLLETVVRAPQRPWGLRMSHFHGRDCLWGSLFSQDPTHPEKHPVQRAQATSSHLPLSQKLLGPRAPVPPPQVP